MRRHVVGPQVSTGSKCNTFLRLSQTGDLVASSLCAANYHFFFFVFSLRGVYCYFISGFPVHLDFSVEEKRKVQVQECLRINAGLVGIIFAKFSRVQVQN